jgi:hypothetical protein
LNIDSTNSSNNAATQQNINFNYDQFGSQSNSLQNTTNTGTLNGNFKPNNFNFAPNNNFNFDISKLDNSKKDGNNFEFKF